MADNETFVITVNGLDLNVAMEALAKRAEQERCEVKIKEIRVSTHGVVGPAIVIEASFVGETLSTLEEHAANFDAANIPPIDEHGDWDAWVNEYRGSTQPAKQTYVTGYVEMTGVTSRATLVFDALDKSNPPQLTCKVETSKEDDDETKVLMRHELRFHYPGGAMGSVKVLGPDNTELEEIETGFPDGK